jgi:hypothetical protein
MGLLGHDTSIYCIEGTDTGLFPQPVKTVFERLSGSNVFGLMPDPSFFTFARLSLPPSLGCLDDAIGHEAKLL